MSRTSLETQKLDLMDEVSYLKLKLVGMEEKHTNTQAQEPADTEQNKAAVWKASIYILLICNYVKLLCFPIKSLPSIYYITEETLRTTTLISDFLHSL